MEVKMNSCFIMYILCMCLVFLRVTASATEKHENVTINFQRTVQIVDELFMGVTLDTGLVKKRWNHFDFHSEKMLSLARGLAPCYLRLGGTEADQLTFQKTDTFHQKRDADNGTFIMTAKDWDLLNTFTSNVGWNLIFDLNVVIWRKDGKWDPTNALSLLNYTLSKGYKVAGFELGNEPDAFIRTFNKTINASRLAADFAILQHVLKTVVPAFQSSLIIGPDLTHLGSGYFDKFFAAGAGKVVDIATFHHYYFNGKLAKLEDFVDPQIMDHLTEQILKGIQILKKDAPGKPLWLGETSTAYGGGAPGLSDVYVAGFMWMDKLGLGAKHGLKGVLRQTFYGGNYALLDTNDLSPNPDYWLTLLYKRLVGNKVFNVTTTETSGHLRVYCHCTNTKNAWGYPPGSVTVYAMNLLDVNVTVNFSQFQGKQFDVFLLTPEGDEGLKSRQVNLNGKILALEGDQLPPLVPEVRVDNVHFPTLSFGFVVIPDAKVPACMD